MSEQRRIELNLRDDTYIIIDRAAKELRHYDTNDIIIIPFQIFIGYEILYNHDSNLDSDELIKTIDVKLFVDDEKHLSHDLNIYHNVMGLYANDNLFNDILRDIDELVDELADILEEKPNQDKTNEKLVIKAYD